MTEEWRPVCGYEGLYEVSSRGRIKSHQRKVSRVMATGGDENTYPMVNLSRGGVATLRSVHRIVAEAFLPKGDGDIVRHLNDVKNDNRVENLAWGTLKDNSQDAIRNGKNPKLAMTACSKGHPYTPENVTFNSGKRVCRTCKAEYEKRSKERYRAKLRAAGIPLHKGLNALQNQHDHGDRFDNRAAVKLRQHTTTKEN